MTNTQGGPVPFAASGGRRRLTARFRRSAAARAPYDDIIIGAGSAGAPLAARLSEDGARRVLLVEAGPYYPTTERTPQDLLDGNRMSLADHGWGHTAHTVAGRSIMFPQGRVVGGSSAVGNTVALRGLPADYDAWAAAGNPGWAWSDVLPYFVGLEDDLDFSGAFHGQGGPIPIRRWQPDELTTVQRAFLDACVDAGHPEAKDHNHPDATGIGPIPSNRRDATTRVSAAMGYLADAAGREHLAIRADTLVHRVLFEGSRAVGVEVSSGGRRTERILARRVILAAGAIGSPAILLRSGIGPSADLRRLGIAVRVAHPGVGAGLVDHPRSGVFMVPKPGAENFGKAAGQMVLRTSADSVPDANNMHYYMVNHFDLTRQFPELQRVAGAAGVFGVMTVVEQPFSRGRVTLASADAGSAPRIELNSLADERDVRLLIDGVRTCRDLMRSKQISENGLRIALPDGVGLDSDEDLRTYVELTVDSTYNPVGTVRMGPATDPLAVVDHRCALRGVEGLHVVDASVMPSMVRANTNLTSMMIGERAAALLR